MEWVETTGRSVQEAKEAALDELGVDEADAEFEIVAEAQTGLFGRLRSEARVRARVKPTAPRPKEDRRDRKRRNSRSSSGSGSSSENGGPGRNRGGGKGSDRGTGASATPDTVVTTPAASVAEAPIVEGSPGDASGRSAGGQDAENRPRRRGGRNRSRSGSGGSTGGNGGRVGSRPGGAAERAPGSDNNEDGDDLATKGTGVEVDLDRQAEVAVDFLSGLTREFGLQANVDVTRPAEDTVELQLTGADLGILIGPKGATLVALQNLTRTVVFNETGGNNGHIDVDISGYRQKRSEALSRFATQVAEKVKETGQRTALEPMTAVDRKVVHDTISNIEGVNTISEGEEPRRRVVVLPG